jgi:hypothetical protein
MRHAGDLEPPFPRFRVDMTTLDMLTLNEAGKRIVYAGALLAEFGNVSRWFP